MAGAGNERFAAWEADLGVELAARGAQSVEHELRRRVPLDPKCGLLLSPAASARRDRAPTALTAILSALS